LLSFIPSHVISRSLYCIRKQKTDATYAQELLLHATQLFEFGDKHRGIGSHDFYGSSGYKDELAWAATWLHKVRTDGLGLEEVHACPHIIQSKSTGLTD
jgi:hypothetical protein